MNRARNNTQNNNLGNTGGMNNMNGRTNNNLNDRNNTNWNDRNNTNWNDRNDTNNWNGRGENNWNDRGGTGNMNDRGTANRRVGRNPNGAALSGSLAEQIRALCFVKVELELYLDTHPRCRTALDYYYQTIEELKRLTEEYENTVGPLTPMGNVSTEQWNWVDGPWPWQQAGDFMREGER